MLAGIVIGPGLSVGPTNVLPANMLIRQGAPPHAVDCAAAKAAPRVRRGSESEHAVFRMSCPLKELTYTFDCARALPATRRPHSRIVHPKARMVTSFELGSRGGELFSYS